MATVTVGCRLPHGLVLEVKDSSGNPVFVTLAGKNADMGGYLYLTPVMCGYTEVDEDYMNAWLDEFKDSAMVKSGAVFIQKNQSSAKAQNKELQNEKTGFDPLPKSKEGVETLQDSKVRAKD